MKIVFFGSDDFADTHLKALINAGMDIAGCVTQPDRAKGRGLKMVVSPIKVRARENGIPVFQPETLKSDEVVQVLSAYQADYFVVVAYGQFLPERVLKLPGGFCLNVHGSLLPHYRGAAPVNWAILNGDKMTGVSVIKMNVKMDAGDILQKSFVEIGKEDTSASLRVKLAGLGAQTLIRVLENLRRGQFTLTPQDNLAASYAPKLTKEMGRIDWSHTAFHIHQQLRGLQPWPGVYTFHRAQRVKILDATAVEMQDKSVKAGQVVHKQKDGFVVACGDQGVLVKSVQPDSGKAMSAAAYCSGHQLEKGDILGI